MSRLDSGSPAGRIATITAVLTVAALLCCFPTSFGWAFALPQAPQFELGFGPSTMTGVSDGVPVYTTGDSMWVSSGYNQTVLVSLLTPNSHPVLTRSIEPRYIVPLYSFGSVDPEGMWSLQIVKAGGNTTIPIEFVATKAHQATIDSLQYSLSGDNLSIAAHASIQDAYDEEVCAVSRGTMVNFEMPGFAGTGTVGLNISRGVAPSTITTSGTISSPFSFWFELYYPYSFSEDGGSNNITPNNSTLLLRTLRVAESKPVLISSAGSPSNGTLEWGVAPRQGRYLLVAFFQSAGDIYSSQTRVLMTNDGSWVPLDSCGVQPVESQSFAYQASLAGNSSAWPRKLYLMYRSSGVEFVSSATLAANVSRVSFVSPPWPEGLQDATLDVAPNQSIRQMSQQGGSFYVLARQYPISFNYSLSVEGIRDASGTLLLDRPYLSLERQVNLSELNVNVLSDESTAIELRVMVSGGIITRQLLADENVSLFLPGGPANVTASHGGDSQNARVTLTDHLESTVVFNFGAGILLSALELFLFVTAALGVGANLVWLLRSKSGSRKWRNEMGRGQSEHMGPISNQPCGHLGVKIAVAWCEHA